MSSLTVVSICTVAAAAATVVVIGVSTFHMNNLQTNWTNLLVKENFLLAFIFNHLRHCYTILLF